MRTLLLIALALAACDDLDDGGEACSAPEEISGEIVSAPTRLPVTGDLEVRGTISAPVNATIYAVLVNGIEATSTSSFRSWTSTIPIGVLVDGVTDGKAKLSVTAHSNCGAPREVDSVEIAVDDEPAIVVDRIELSAALPNGQSYLPSTKPVSAVLTVVANPGAAGARVALSSSLGTVSPAEVTLAGDGMADASAHALFASPMPGTAVIVASAKGKSDHASIPVIGPPTFAPDGASIPAGQSLRVTVLATAPIDGCHATPASGIQVTSGPDSNLMEGSGGVDQTMDGYIDIDITVASPLGADTTTTLTCRDPFGQAATSAFTGTP